MYATTYHRASSVDEAVTMATGNDDAKYVSGGQTLIATMKQRLASPSDLIDLRHIADLKGITVTGRTVRIGAAATHAEVASSAELRAVCPALCKLAGGIGDPHVRHLGTLGGSIANNDPAADYPSAMLGLDATIITNSREIPAGDFFQGLFTTALEEGEMITAIRFDAPERAAYAKFANPASRYAMVGVFVAQRGGSARVAVTGAGGDGVFRHEAMEQALAGNWSADALSSVDVEADNLMSDIHASSDYRANLVKVMARRAVSATL